MSLKKTKQRLPPEENKTRPKRAKKKETVEESTDESIDQRKQKREKRDDTATTCDAKLPRAQYPDASRERLSVAIALQSMHQHDSTYHTSRLLTSAMYMHALRAKEARRKSGDDRAKLLALLTVLNRGDESLAFKLAESSVEEIENWGFRITMQHGNAHSTPTPQTSRFPVEAANAACHLRLEEAAREIGRVVAFLDRA